MRGEYERRRAEIRRGFELNGDGLRAAQARAALVDEFVRRLWAEETQADPRLAEGVAIAAVGGYGRGQLFPWSDVDLFFCVEKSRAGVAKAAVRSVSQSLWDCGMQVSLGTRPPGECERFDAANPEFGLALLDLRSVGGDAVLFARLHDKAVAKMRARDAKAISVELARLTRERHAKYGGTLFHLEPNIKDCPGGLRDANVCEWLSGLQTGSGKKDGAKDAGPRTAGSRTAGPIAAEEGEFAEALAFLAAVRCFLHYRHERDDNVLDWQAQDAAAAQGIGLGAGFGQDKREPADPAYWMRAYFRCARIVQRRLLREFEQAGPRLEPDAAPRRLKLAAQPGLRWTDGRLELETSAPGGIDAAHEPEIVLAAFAAMARTGARLSRESEARIAAAVPVLSANLEEGPALWRSLSAILTGERAGTALRAMHTLGVLELILPEFHGIDALVIRDAYHRYTVDEHTFVLIDTLHGLTADAGRNAPEWRVKFGAMIRELHNPGLLYLAALLHDTGKGRVGRNHAMESANMARGVLQRLEMDSYDSGQVLRLIETHLEMSAALRRDIFDAETVQTFAAKVQTHELLRMLTLFTYADIAAVHPDALTPWKAENLWRLSMAAANQLDRNVDEERVHTVGTARLLYSGGRPGGGGPPGRSGKAEERGGLGGERNGLTGERGGLGGEKEQKIARMLSLARGREAEAERFLEGFPERYVRTRSPETMRQHFEMTRNFAAEPFQIAFQHGNAQASASGSGTAVSGAAGSGTAGSGTAGSGSTVSEITLVTQDRPRLFADIAAALAAWGMNVVTADAFANAEGVVVDSFRFIDTFRTLELNEIERERFVASVRELVAGRVPVEKLLSGRRRARRPAPRVVVQTKVEFDDTASAHSTLLQVIAQDVPGLLRAISRTLSALGYNVEVALVDTEGETAIDVFYLTSEGARLTAEQESGLREALLAAIRVNAG
jgi:[protein-PII] uridylyltransferase